MTSRSSDPAAMATACTLAARGLRLPARQRRAGAVAVRAASTRMPPPTSSHSHPDKPKDLLEVGDVASIVATLGLTGSTIGTYMDGIHTRAQVLIYDKLPLVHGGLHTSAVVPPLLAAFYMVLGSLYLKADSWMLEREDAATEAAYRRCNLGTMCLSFGGVAATLALSSALYASEVPPDQISLALAACAAANYLVFDATKQGLALALLCALACPAAELMIMHILQLWHYPGATLFTEIPHSGMLAWVPWCYFAYTPAVAQLTRYLKKTA